MLNWSIAFYSELRSYGVGGKKYIAKMATQFEKARVRGDAKNSMGGYGPNQWSGEVLKISLFVKI